MDATCLLLLPHLSKSITPRQMEVLAMRCGVQTTGAATGQKGSLAGTGGSWKMQSLSAQKIGRSEVESLQKIVDGIDKII